MPASNLSTLNLRDETFESLQDRLTGLRAMTLSAWRVHGRGTTRAVALMAGMDLLTFRPRTTELVQIGLVKLVDRQHSEGIYEAATPEEVRTFLAENREQAFGTVQPELKLA